VPDQRNQEIHQAIDAGDVTAARELLDAEPALVNARDELSRTPLHIAVSRGHTEIVHMLLAAGATITAYDPVATAEAKRIYADEPGITFSSRPLDACAGADALIIVTEWKEFRSPDFESIRERLKQPVIIDGRNMYVPRDVREAGFEYISIGRP